jgi:hypothetical protein
MNIATYELTIPHTIGEIERRANRVRHRMPARPARWSLGHWLRARLVAIGIAVPANSRRGHPAR